MRVDRITVLMAAVIVASVSSAVDASERTAGEDGWTDVPVRVISGQQPARLAAVSVGDLPTAAAEDEQERAERWVVPNMLRGPLAAPPEPGTGLDPTQEGPPRLTMARTEGTTLYSQGSPQTDADYPAIDLRFDGPFQSFVTPPDPVMAVGQDHVVSLINQRIAVYDKDGTLLDGPTSLRDFFGIPSSFSTFDPLAVYDPFSERYISVCTAKDDAAQDSRLYIAFTQTADATGEWNTYYIDADRDQAGNWADYPSIGIDRNAVYLTANMFSFSGFFRNVTLFVYDKEDGYAGRPLDNSHLIDVQTSTGASPFRLRPATIEQVVEEDVYYLMHGSQSFAGSLHLFRLTGDRFSSPDLSATTVGLPGSYAGPGGARQPGSGSPPVDTLGGSLWNVIYRDGTLWTAHAVSESGSIVAWVHRYAVSSSSATREQSYEIADSDNDTYFPYVLPDSEDDDFALLTAYSGPQRHVTGRYWNIGADGEVRYTELLVDSDRLNTSERHGDYFAVGYDPTDRNRLWMIAQFMRDSSFSGNQKIASVRFEDESQSPSSPPPLPDGDDVPGEQVELVKAAGDELTVSWDAETCPASDNHLVWYDLNQLASYDIVDERCDIGTSGSWTGLPPAGSVAVIVVGDDDQDTEGSHGVDSAGQERPSESALCTTIKRTDGTCTP